MARDFAKDGTMIYAFAADLGGRLAGASAATVSLWFKADTLDAGGNSNVLFRASSGSSILFRLAVHSAGRVDTISRSQIADSNQAAGTASASVATGTLYHFAAVFDYANDQVRLYLDGAPHGSPIAVTYGSGTLAFTSTNVESVGSSGGSPAATDQLDGRISHAAVYRGDLGDAGVAALFTSSPLIVEPASLAYYNPLDGTAAERYFGAPTVTGTIPATTADTPDLFDSITTPAAGDVRSGVEYGPTDDDGASLAGTLTLPDPGVVLVGEQYGAGGTEFTGTFGAASDADHPTLVLCDDLVNALVAAWSPVAPDEVLRDYFPRYGDGEDSSVALTAGRKVVICPSDYDSVYETRAHDLYTHSVTVVVIERYADRGVPPKSWIDERVEFVHTHVVKGFDFGRSGGPAWNRQLRTASIDVEVCDPEKLVTGGHLFLATVEILFRESVPTP